MSNYAAIARLYYQLQTTVSQSSAQCHLFIFIILNIKEKDRIISEQQHYYAHSLAVSQLNHHFKSSSYSSRRSQSE